MAHLATKAAGCRLANRLCGDGLRGVEADAPRPTSSSGPNTLLDPIVNIKLGVAYLRTLTNGYDDMSTALAAYNWGPGRIDRRLRRGEELPTEYINRVTQLYGRKPGPETGRS